MTDKAIFYRIEGEVVGDLWMGGEAWKEVGYDFNRRFEGPWERKHETSRDAVLSLTNDGDFQSNGLLRNAYLTIQVHTGDRKRAIRSFPLRIFAGIRDCLVDLEKDGGSHDTI